MTDRWSEQLRCPKCRKAGTATFSQVEDELPTAITVPDGFTLIQDQYGPSFRCDSCGVDVQP